jgi:S1-C subfamily serine protease
MNLLLEIAEAGRSPRRLNITRSLATIGRSAKCDVRIDSDIVSSRHARLKRYQERVIIEDLGSTNGVLVNGDLVTSSTPVGDGDKIQLGSGGPLITIVAGASGHLLGASPSRTSSAQRRLLIASAVIGALLLIAGAAMLFWFASSQHDRLEITSMTDPRLAQAVGLVICGADLAVEGRLNEVQMTSGSAFVVTADGHLITNRHVVEGFHRGNDELKPVLARMIDEAVPAGMRDKALSVATQLIQRPRVWVAIDGQILDAEVKKISDNYDLAVLKVDRKNSPYFAFSTEDTTRLTEVSAIGFPGAASEPFSKYEAFEKLARQATGSGIRRFFTPSDLEFTQTRGYVSRLVEKPEANDVGKTEWIQHTASISEGNSGGPLCLKNGLVVGVNSMMSTVDANMKLSFSVNQIRDELESVTGKLHWR